MDEIFYFKSSRLLRAKYYFPFTVASRFLSIVYPGRDHFGFSTSGANLESTASTVSR
jgi:hypothetical protein